MSNPDKTTSDSPVSSDHSGALDQDTGSDTASISDGGSDTSVANSQNGSPGRGRGRRPFFWEDVEDFTDLGTQKMANCSFEKCRHRTRRQDSKYCALHRDKEKPSDNRKSDDPVPGQGVDTSTAGTPSSVVSDQSGVLDQDTATTTDTSTAQGAGGKKKDQSL